MGAKGAATEQVQITTITLPVLGEGEKNAGLIFKDGAPSHWVILVPGESTGISWKKAGTWAKELGAELPTRAEQSLLFANLKGEFQERFYWSCEQRAEVGDYAWLQFFGDGLQYYWYTSSKYFARAVRRLPI